MREAKPEDVCAQGLGEAETSGPFMQQLGLNSLRREKKTGCE